MQGSGYFFAVLVFEWNDPIQQKLWIRSFKKARFVKLKIGNWLWMSNLGTFWWLIWKSVKVIDNQIKTNKNWFLSKNLLSVDPGPQNSTTEVMLKSVYISTKGAFFSESEIHFSNLPISQKNYSKKLSWAWNLNKLFTDMGGNFKFQAQDSFLE